VSCHSRLDSHKKEMNNADKRNQCH
jgi:hypothetical protein